MKKWIPNEFSDIEIQLSERCLKPLSELKKEYLCKILIISLDHDNHY